MNFAHYTRKVYARNPEIESRVSCLTQEHEFGLLLAHNDQTRSSGGPDTNANTLAWNLASGSSVAVVGGGPAGSFFAYFLLDLAQRVGSSNEKGAVSMGTCWRWLQPKAPKLFGIGWTKLLGRMAARGLRREMGWRRGRICLLSP
jgi:hypothetical protein